MSESNLITGDNLALQNVRYMFIIDDDPVQTEMINDYLKERYLFEVKKYATGEEALIDVAKLKPEIVILDYHMNSNNPGAKNGVEILKEIRVLNPATRVIMFTGEDNINIALDSMRHGAHDYIIKGETSFNKIENTVNRLGEMHRLEAVNVAQKRTILFLGVCISIIIVLAILYAVLGSPFASEST
ncbi:MAG: response regulator [Bacteroidetes bacterium]|nr:response regulator [Bacteroidota bacterium]